jgi:hypothetical protein
MQIQGVRRIALLVFAALACCLIFFGISGVAAAAGPDSTGFTDPYNGGEKLPKGGEEPGKAYMAFVNAAYKKDYAKICELTSAPADVPRCLQQREVLDVHMALHTQPKSHQVLGGFRKGEEATLNVLYTFATGQQSSGFVVMKQHKGKWIISKFGGSASVSIHAEAKGSVELGSGSAEAWASVGQSPKIQGMAPPLGEWDFVESDADDAFISGLLTISEKDDHGEKSHDCSVNMVNEADQSWGREFGGTCTWDPGARELSFSGYTGILSDDGKEMKGTYTREEMNWDTNELVKITGSWQADYDGEVDAAAAAASWAPHPMVVVEFERLKISADTQEYAGKCPASVAFTVDMAFKMPPPDNVSYHWEFSDGTKTGNTVIKPPANGQMSLTEVWKGGKLGEKRDVRARFTAEAGRSIFTNDSQQVSVICK